MSSVALARVREARFGTWDKNDPKDARAILFMLQQNMVQIYAGTHDIQEVANTVADSLETRCVPAARTSAGIRIAVSAAPKRSTVRAARRCGPAAADIGRCFDPAI